MTATRHQMHNMQDDLSRLLAAIRRRNEADAEIASIIGRPAEKGHIGEFIASRILGIELHRSATHKGSDGHFADGPLKGRTVNVKLYGQREGILDLCAGQAPDFYLVLTGAKAAAASSVGVCRPLVIEAVYLFDARRLHDALTQRGAKIGTASSVAKQYWEEAEIWPTARNPLLRLSDDQRRMFAMFTGTSQTGVQS